MSYFVHKLVFIVNVHNFIVFEFVLDMIYALNIGYLVQSNVPILPTLDAAYLWFDFNDKRACSLCAFPC